jgi:hypothetical protein
MVYYYIVTLFVLVQVDYLELHNVNYDNVLVARFYLRNLYSCLINTHNTRDNN